MLSELKNLDINRPDMDTLLAMAAFGRTLESEFETLGVETPEWLALKLKAVRREVKSRNHDAVEAKLRSARARLETLKTPDEKRTAVAREIKKLEQELAEV